MTSGKRLWIISELYYPEQTSTGYFLTRIAEGLASEMPVHVICGQPTYSEQGIRAPATEDRNGTRIHRMRATHFPKDRLALRAINMVTLTLAVTWFVLRNLRAGDRLLIVTNPPTLPPIAGLIARLKRVESHLLVHDVYPEVLAATGFLDVGSLTYRVLQRLSAATLRLFDSIIVLGRDMEALIEEKLLKDRRPITIIPNWGDVEEVKQIARVDNPFYKIAGVDATYVFQFSGNIGRTHDIETILTAARSLRHREDILFLFIGFGGKLETISQAIAGGELPNVRLLPRQPRELLGPMLGCSNATIIPFVEAMRGISVPSRMYNVMAAGTPIIAIADSDSEIGLVVSEENAGWPLAPGDDRALASLIENLASKAGEIECTTRGKNGRKAVELRYTYEHILIQYKTLLTNFK